MLKLTLRLQGPLLNQHGFAHAGFGFSLADIAARYAAITHLPTGHNILTVESKINYLAPAKGDKSCAVGRIIRPGRRLSMMAADLFASIEKNPTENCDFTINNEAGSPGAGARLAVFLKRFSNAHGDRLKGCWPHGRMKFRHNGFSPAQPLDKHRWIL